MRLFSKSPIKLDDGEEVIRQFGDYLYFTIGQTMGYVSGVVTTKGDRTEELITYLKGNGAFDFLRFKGEPLAPIDEKNAALNERLYKELAETLNNFPDWKEFYSGPSIKSSFLSFFQSARSIKKRMLETEDYTEKKLYNVDSNTEDLSLSDFIEIAAVAFYKLETYIKVEDVKRTAVKLSNARDNK